MKLSSLAFYAVTLGVIGWILWPHTYHATDNLVGSSVIRKILQGFPDNDVRTNVIVRPTSQPDVSEVEASVEFARPEKTQDRLTRRTHSYRYRMNTRSRCFELTEGCLLIKPKESEETVSVNPAI